MKQKSKFLQTEGAIKSLKDFRNFIIKNALFFLIILGVSFLIYGNVIKGDFLNLDDQEGIVTNLTIRDFKKSIQSFNSNNIYLAILYKFFGLKSWAYHIGSIVMHSIVGILVFTFVYLLFGKKPALISTFLFLVHPVNTEAVSWLSGKVYLFTAICIMPILISWILYRKTGKKITLIFLFIWYSFALFINNSPWLLVAPFLLVVIDQFFYEENILINWTKVKEYLIVGIPSLAYALFVFTSRFGERVTSLVVEYYQDPEYRVPILNRVPYIIYMQLRQLVFPVYLSIYHEGNFISSIMYTIMIIVTAVYIRIIIKKWRQDRILTGLLILIPLTLLPSFSPVSVAWLAADRYVYMGSIFYSIFLAGLILWLKKELDLENFDVVASIVLFSMFFIRVFLRNQDYHSSKNMWLATLKTAPNSYRVYNNLGDVYSNEGKLDLALENFFKSVQLKPNYADAVHNIGYTYFVKGEIDKAEYYLKKSFEMNPLLVESLHKLALLEFQRQNNTAAREYLNRALEINPNFILAQESLKNLNQIEVQQVNQ